MNFFLCQCRSDRFLKPVRSIVLTLSLTGCVVGSDYVPPQIELPKQWTEAATSKQILQLQEWWKTFNDPVLNQLIDQATHSNLDLKLAESRIRASRSEYNATIAAALPSLSTHSSVSRRLNNTSGTSGSSAGGGFGVGNQLINIFQVGFDAVWEIDLFGGVQRALEVADANSEFAEESRRDRLVTLFAEVARNYIQLRANQQMQRITLENLHSQEETLKLIQVRQRAGLISEVDSAQNQAQLATLRSQLPLYETATKQAIHALALLLGQTPDKLNANLQNNGIIPISQNPGLADLPAELLRRRPDIRMAERKLAATNAEIGIAVNEQYPKINLSAFLGLQNTSIANFTPIGKSWSTAASLTMPIFNWGRIQANIKVKEALNEQAFITYQSTVLNAFKEVEDALVAQVQEQQRGVDLDKSVKAQQLLLTLATERYRKGLSSYLEVLDVQRGVYLAQKESLDSQSKQSLYLVALNKALGGGWTDATTHQLLER
jgi:NodT family efflux transporter outer membrane factor (OMF) lipoprotein